MFYFLEKIRGQSKSKRTFIAFSVSLLFTGFIFVMWLVTEKNMPEGTSVAQNTASNTPTDTLVRTMRDGWNSLVGAGTDLTESVKEVNFYPSEVYDTASSTVEDEQ